MPTSSDRVSRLTSILGTEVILLACKQPIRKRWQKLTLSDTRTPGYQRSLQSAAQIGVLCGGGSGDLLCLDFDDANALEAFHRKMPPELGTAVVVGARGARGAKHFYRIQPTTVLRKTKLFRDGSEVGDFLGNGGQAIVDGIHHDTRQPYRLSGTAVTMTSLGVLQDLLGAVGITIGRPQSSACHVDAERRTQDADSGFSRNEGGTPHQRESDKGSAKSQAILAKTLATERADARLATLSEDVQKLYRSHLEPHWKALAGQRNDFLKEAMPLLLRRVAPTVALSLTDAWYFLHREMFAATAQEHRREAEAMVRGVLESYGASLGPGAREIYASLSEERQAAFRICLDLASRAKPPAALLSFFMSGAELGLRLGLDTQAAFRVLVRFEATGLLAIVEKGRQRAKGHRGQATAWRWQLAT